MEINQQNIETWCLLYVDNALTSDEKMAVDTFIANNSQYESLLTSYQQTIVPIETHIQYEDKALLYRFEALETQLDPTFKKSLYKKESSTIVMPLWAKWTASVAAIVLLVFSIRFLQDKDITSTSNINFAQIEKQNINPSTTIIDNKIDHTISVKAKDISKKSTESFINHSEATPQIEYSNTKDGNSFVLNSVDPILTPITSIEENKNTSITSAAVSNADSEAITSNNPSQEEIVQTIIEDNNDRVIYVGALEINSDKLRGVTRRINALLKRREEAPVESDIVVGDLVISTYNLSVFRAGKELSLTPKEFQLLSLLASANGRIVTKNTISEKLWDYNVVTNQNTIEVYINSLRKKIDKDHEQKLIHTKVGYGYFLKVI